MLNPVLALTTDQANSMSAMFLILCIGGFFVYWLPTIIAWSRGHHNLMAIGLTNFFLGWTFIGYIVALIWAHTKVQVDAPLVHAQAPVSQPAMPESKRIVCDVCGESIAAAAKLCRFCNSPVRPDLARATSPAAPPSTFTPPVAPPSTFTSPSSPDRTFNRDVQSSQMKIWGAK